MPRSLAFLMLLVVPVTASATTESRLSEGTYSPTAADLHAAAQVVRSGLSDLPDAPSSLRSTERSVGLDRPEGNQSSSRFAFEPSFSEKLVFDGHANLHLSSLSASLIRACFTGLYKAALARSGSTRNGGRQTVMGKRSAVAMADRCTSSFFGTFLFPTLFHQEPRYQRLGDTASLWRRAEYSVSEVVIAQNEAGSQTLNSSFLLGAFASKSLDNLFQSKRHSGFHPTMTRCEKAFLNRLESNLESEIMPDVESYLFKQMSAGLKRIKKHMPFSHSSNSESFNG